MLKMLKPTTSSGSDRPVRNVYHYLHGKKKYKTVPLNETFKGQKNGLRTLFG